MRHDKLSIAEAEIRSAHAARVNIAFANYKLGHMPRREFAAECAEAERERQNKLGDAIREYVNTL